MEENQKRVKRWTTSLPSSVEILISGLFKGLVSEEDLESSEFLRDEILVDCLVEEAKSILNFFERSSSLKSRSKAVSKVLFRFASKSFWTENQEWLESVCEKFLSASDLTDPKIKLSPPIRSWLSEKFREPSDISHTIPLEQESKSNPEQEPLMSSHHEDDSKQKSNSVNEQDSENKNHDKLKHPKDDESEHQSERKSNTNPKSSLENNNVNEAESKSKSNIESEKEPKPESKAESKSKSEPEDQVEGSLIKDLIGRILTSGEDDLVGELEKLEGEKPSKGELLSVFEVLRLYPENCNLLSILLKFVSKVSSFSMNDSLKLELIFSFLLAQKTPGRNLIGGTDEAIKKLIPPAEQRALITGNFKWLLQRALKVCQDKAGLDQGCFAVVRSLCKEHMGEDVDYAYEEIIGLLLGQVLPHFLSGGLAEPALKLALFLLTDLLDIEDPRPEVFERFLDFLETHLSVWLNSPKVLADLLTELTTCQYASLFSLRSHSSSRPPQFLALSLLTRRALKASNLDHALQDRRIALALAVPPSQKDFEELTEWLEKVKPVDTSNQLKTEFLQDLFSLPPSALLNAQPFITHNTHIFKLLPAESIPPSLQQYLTD